MRPSSNYEDQNEVTPRNYADTLAGHIRAFGEQIDDVAHRDHPLCRELRLDKRLKESFAEVRRAVSDLATHVECFGEVYYADSEPLAGDLEYDIARDMDRENAGTSVEGWING